ncbi:hypothetical protein ADL19_05655 [Streptomyces purpurogeneiscleroticus]|nr:hypothetical protein ADL19_05655 [Streptomyces purpurogeneiscleroticus]
MTILLPDYVGPENRHVMEGAQRVLDQIRLIARLKSAGHDTAEAEGLFKEFRHALMCMQEHRQRLQAEYGAQ